MVAISTIDYHVCLRSPAPEEKVFAILADFGKDTPETAVTNIAASIAQTAIGDLEKERLKNQWRILAQLRTLAFSKLEVMEHASTFFKEENDIFYRRGEIRGEEKATEKRNTSYVKKLLQNTDFDTKKIAMLAEVSVVFVEKIKRGL